MTPADELDAFFDFLRDCPGRIVGAVVPDTRAGEALIGRLRTELDDIPLEVATSSLTPGELGARAAELGRQGDAIWVVPVDGRRRFSSQDDFVGFWQQLNFQRERLAFGSVRTCLLLNEASEQGLAMGAGDLYGWVTLYRFPESGDPHDLVGIDEPGGATRPDVFISYNRADEEAAVRLYETLEERRLVPWIGVTDATPGRPWQQEAEAILAIAPAVAVLVGASGLGPWQTLEMRAGLDELVQRGALAIPVILEDATETPKLPPFLKQMTWVDLRKHGDLDRLVRAVESVRPAAPEPSTDGGPPLHNLPFLSLGSLLKGRDAHLAELAAGLDAVTPGVLVQRQSLHGLGGVGKTRLAVEYAWRHGGRYEAVFFVGAESPAELRRNLAGLVGPELLDLVPADATEHAAVATAMAWLREHPDWLLILDNVDSDEAAASVRDVLPRLDRGHVLITSRRTRWQRGIRKVDIDVLTESAAARFLLESTENEREARGDDAEQAIKLARALDGLPLALEQAASYVGYHGLSLCGYLEEWRTDLETVLAWHDDEMVYPVPVAATWLKSIERLGAHPRAVLRLLAHLAPEPVPVGMLVEGTEVVEEAVALFCDETGMQPDEGTPRTALADLAAYSLVRRDRGEVSVHRLVQAVVRTRLEKERRPGWTKLAARLVMSFGPEQAADVRTWPEWDRLRPHAERVIELAESDGVEDAASGLMNQLGLLLFQKAVYSQAEPLMRRALALDEKALGEEHPKVAIRLNNLASLLQATNRLSAAEPLMRRALAIVEASLPEHHPWVQRFRKNLDVLVALEDGRET